jgi:hypothetical protein
MQKAAEKLCQSIPNGMAFGVNGSIGVIAGAAAGGEIVINFDTGNVSLYGLAGLSTNNGGASASGTVGYIYKLGDPSTYQGPFTGAVISYGGMGIFGSVTSPGGMTNPANINTNKPFNFGVAASIGTGLLKSAVPFQVSSTTYSAPTSLGNIFQNSTLFTALSAADPAIGALAIARQACDHN